MSDNLQQQVFTYIKDTAEKIGDFAAKEIPPFVEEFLRWKFWEAGFYAGIWLVFFFLITGSMIYWWKINKESIVRSLDTGESHGFAFIMGGLISLVGLIPTFFEVFIPNAVTMLQIYIAPKVYLLEKAAECLK